MILIKSLLVMMTKNVYSHNDDHSNDDEYDENDADDNDDDDNLERTSAQGGQWTSSPKTIIW